MMAQTATSNTSERIEPAAQTSWLPMLVIGLAQIQLSFNVSALPVSIGDIVEDLGTTPSSVAVLSVTALCRSSRLSLRATGYSVADSGGWSIFC